MDVTRRQADGTLAELLGAGALASDVQLRTFGLRRAAERSLPILSQDMRNALSAYADGVNAYVARNPLPAEYTALEITTFRSWAPVDSLVHRQADRLRPVLRAHRSGSHHAPGAVPGRRCRARLQRRGAVLRRRQSSRTLRQCRHRAGCDALELERSARSPTWSRTPPQPATASRVWQLPRPP